MAARSGEENLGAFLARRARRMSDGHLALQAALGLVGAVASLIWRGDGWMVVCALALALAAFGAWGILDRELQERGPVTDHTPLRLARTLAAVLGAVAALALVFGMLALALGTWVS